MKKSDIKKIENIINQDNIKGKILLKEFLWVKTTEPKFKIGDKVLFSDLSRRVYGVVVKDFVGTIKSWRYWYDRENPNKSFIRYEIEFIFNEEKFTSYQIERNIKKTRKTNNDNKKIKNDTRDCILM
jgi:hypothetical protein